MSRVETLQRLLDRGFAALSRGDLDTAGRCCREAIGQQQDLVPAHFLVGLVALEARDRPTAFSAFQSVVRLDRDHAAAWAQLARLYLGEGQVRLADAALRETRRLQPDDPVVLDLVGIVLSQMGEHGAAQAFFARANTRRPGHPPFMLNLANNLVYHGDTARADQIFRDIIHLQPDSPQAHWALASSVKARDSRHIETMQQLLSRRGGNPRARAFYHYAIGKEFEDLQQWPEAFAAFSAGAAARRGTVEYDESAEVALFEALENLFTPEWLAAQPPGDPDPGPIFVLGQPRTGTTLVERIITSHSQVHSAGELQQFGLALRRLSDYRDPRRFSAELFRRAAELDPRAVGRLYLQTSARMRGNTPRFVDKLPQNYLLLPLILAALPNARIVHLVRDPMDACFASFKQLFADAYLHSYDQGEMARHHARYFRLMQCWRERFPGRFLDLRYEDVARDLAPHARQLIEFLGLPWEDACLDFHRQDSAVTTASAVQVREPAHTRSIGRWQRYADALQPMRQTLAAAGVPESLDAATPMGVYP
ncbi:tetratricopeptide repeat-containing sulfotransferase family protein [Haliea atlantica]